VIHDIEVINNIFFSRIQSNKYKLLYPLSGKCLPTSDYILLYQNDVDPIKYNWDILPDNIKNIGDWDTVDTYEKFNVIIEQLLKLKLYL